MHGSPGGLAKAAGGQICKSGFLGARSGKPYWASFRRREGSGPLCGAAGRPQNRCRALAHATLTQAPGPRCGRRAQFQNGLFKGALSGALFLVAWQRPAT